MPSSIALLLCCIVILFLLVKDVRETHSGSNGLWVASIWMMYCGSMTVYNWLNLGAVSVSQIDYEAGNPIDRTFLAILIVLGLIILSKRKIDWHQLLRNNGMVLLLYIYLGLSIIWSDFQAVSLKRWIRTSGDLIMVLIVLTETSPFESIKKVLKRCAFVLIPLSVLFIKYFRHIGVSYGAHSGVTMWVGVTTHKNSLGQLSCVSALFLLWSLLSMRGKKDLLINSVLLGMTLWLLNGPAEATSKTSLFAFGIGSFVMIMTFLNKKRARSIGKLLITVFVFLILLEVFSNTLLNQSLLEVTVKASGRDMTLTGRTDLWKDLMEIAASDSILGKGYGGFWVGNLANNLWEKHDWRPESAHNGYIDMYVELGLLGLTLMGGVIGFSYQRILKSLLADFEYGTFRMILFVVILFYNLTESSFTKPTSLLWFLFLLVTINIPKSVMAMERKAE